MKLRDLLGVSETTEVSGLAYDARRVTSGDLFFCVPGFTRDGHDFAGQAKEKGAKALVVERRVSVDLPQVQVSDVRAAMAQAAAAFFGHPSSRLDVVGITGTNGKTTTAFILRDLLEATGRQTGLLGTIKAIVGGTDRKLERTAPESIDIQGLLKEMVDGGDVACAMEVSSHALSLRRADGIKLKAGIFTNLSADHFDFHGDMESYFLAKRELFVRLAPEETVINVDDSYGRRLAEQLKGCISFAIDGDADFTATDVRRTGASTSFTLHSRSGLHECTIPLVGRFNVANFLAACGAGRAVGIDDAELVAASHAIQPIPGRFEQVDEGQPFPVIVDYAHSPDALEGVLKEAREMVAGRVIVVFGCGGDRDRDKRPEMGRIASSLADVAILTTDNPRSEKPEAIIDEVLTGAADELDVEIDRRLAIQRGVGQATAEDVVVVTGKGHEQGQEFADRVIEPFDDREVCADAIRVWLKTHYLQETES